MASQLNLDRSDAGVDQMVSAWKDGQSYRVTLDIIQSKSSPSMNTFEVASVTDETEPAEAETSEVETQAPVKPKKPAVSVEY